MKAKFNFGVLENLATRANLDGEMTRPIFRLKPTSDGQMELELPQNKIPDHPDAKKLDKRAISGDDFSPLDNGRSCTDCLFLLLIVCSWVAMTGLGLAATGIVPSEYIKQGGKLHMFMYIMSIL